MPEKMDSVDRAQQDQIDDLFEDRWVVRMILIVSFISGIAQIVEAIVVCMRGTK